MGGQLSNVAEQFRGAWAVEDVASAIRERNNGRVHGRGNKSSSSEVGGADSENRVSFEHSRAICECRSVFDDGSDADVGNGAGLFKRPVDANDRGHENFNAAILLE